MPEETTPSTETEEATVTTEPTETSEVAPIENTEETTEAKERREQAERDGSGKGLTFAERDALEAEPVVEDKTVQQLADVLQLTIAGTQKLLKIDFNHKAKNGDAVVPREIWDKLVTQGLADVPAPPSTETEAATTLPNGLKLWTGPCQLPNGSTCRDAGCWDLFYDKDGKAHKVSNCSPERRSRV